MITYDELFTFVIMLCAVITLVVNIMHKKQRPCSAKVRRYFFLQMPAVRCALTNGSLVINIIMVMLNIYQPLTLILTLY